MTPPAETARPMGMTRFLDLILPLELAETASIMGRNALLQAPFAMNADMMPLPAVTMAMTRRSLVPMTLRSFWPSHFAKPELERPTPVISMPTIIRTVLFEKPPSASDAEVMPVT